MDKGIVYEVEKAIQTAAGAELKIRSINPVSGGCVNQAFKVNSSNENYFFKLNDSASYPGMFDAEAHGLNLLRKAGSIAVPSVIGLGKTADKSFLVLEWIESGKRVKNFFEDFGRRLAKLHSCSQSYFGLDRDNYIGSLRQINNPAESFEEFFITQRLELQLKTAIENGRLPASAHKSFGQLYVRLREIIPPEKPALLHGDLWSGNYMTGSDGYACICDPAVYYGHREADIAMTLLFGGFDHDFYESYHRHFPLENNWRQRVDIFNLYPLLVHVNLFGGGYAGEVMSIVKRF